MIKATETQTVVIDLSPEDIRTLLQQRGYEIPADSRVEGAFDGDRSGGTTKPLNRIRVTWTQTKEVPAVRAEGEG